MFVHADAHPPPQLVSLVRAALQRPGVVLGGFRTMIGEVVGARHVAEQVFCATAQQPL